MSFLGGDNPGAAKAGDVQAKSNAPENATSITPEKANFIDLLSGVGNGTKLFAEGAATTAALDPLNFAINKFDNATGAKFPTVEFSNQQDVNNSTAGTIGKVLGVAADGVVGTTLAASALGGALVGTGALACVSAYVGGLALVGAAGVAIVRETSSKT